MGNKELIGLAAGILTATSIVPQFIKCIREKSVKGISAFLYIVLIAGNGLWAWYGLLLNDLPILITNSFSLVMDAGMLFLKIKYRKRRS